MSSDKTWIEITDPKFFHFIMSWHKSKNYLLSMKVEALDDSQSFFSLCGCNTVLFNRFDSTPNSTASLYKVLKFKGYGSYENPYDLFKALKEEFEPFIKNVVFPIGCEFDRRSWEHPQKIIKCNFEKNEIYATTSPFAQQEFKIPLRIYLSFEPYPLDSIKHSPFVCTQEEFQNGFVEYFSEQLVKVKEEKME